MTDETEITVRFGGIPVVAKVHAYVRPDGDEVEFTVSVRDRVYRVQLTGDDTHSLGAVLHSSGVEAIERSRGIGGEPAPKTPETAETG